jgi:phospholipase C
MDAAKSVMEAIEHVVVIMLENRSFDNVLGYLYGPDDPPKQHIPPLQPGDQPFHGLLFENTEDLKNDGEPPAPGVRATNTPGWDPGEEYEHVNVQLFGSKTAPKADSAKGAPVPGMKGFLKDYSTQCNGNAEDKKQIMRMYGPGDLPVLSALARGYAVSDAWFASVPTQTNANRAFSICGTSLGLVDNGYLTQDRVNAKLANDRFNTDTVWNVLDRNGFSDWGIFWEVAYPPVISKFPYTRNLFPRLGTINNLDSHFHKTEEFFALAKAGTLPRYSYIEPSWGGYVFGESAMGNEYHPPSDVTPGEHRLEQIYRSLKAGKSWDKTLFIVTFDEHGGNYDHVPPGRAIPPSAKADPGQYGFLFDRLGVRVPAILVSPRIAPGTVFRASGDVPYDHTSVIATLLKWLLPGVKPEDWGLGERVRQAPTFDDVVTLDQARTDDVLTPATPAAGTPLKYGDPFYLKHMSGDFVIGAYTGKRYYYPCLGKGGAVRLDFRCGMGAVLNDAIVQIHTGEYLQPSGTESPYFLSYPAIRNFLGAWKDDSDCYYYSTNDAENYGQQYWKVTRKDSRAGNEIRYGDRVYLSSNYADYKGQRLVKVDEYVSTAAGADEWWSIEASTEPRRNTPGVCQFGELVQLKHMSGEYIGLNYWKWSQLVRSGPVKLRLRGGVGDVSDGAAVSIESTESDLGKDNILGVFANSRDCYYAAGGYEAGKQGWRLTKVGGGDAGIGYGDKVCITNLYKRERLVKDALFPTYLTTLEPSNEWWVLEKA